MLPLAVLCRPLIVNVACRSLPGSGFMTCVTTQLGRKSEVEGDERGVVESGYSCRNPAEDSTK
jgi:hypothetical protein